MAAAERPNVVWIVAEDMSPNFACCDETVDRIRSVRTDQFLYIRNFYPRRPHLQPNAYQDGKFIIKRLRERLDRWMIETGDNHSESEAMYDSDMCVHVGQGNRIKEENIATMKRWAAEGR